MPILLLVVWLPDTPRRLCTASVLFPFAEDVGNSS